jgi:hypothetical protein
MSYLPPHKRQEEEWATVQKKPSKKPQPPKKREYVEEFPSLNKDLEQLPRHIKQTPSKPTLSTLFKNSLNRKYKKKQPKIKPGWILLSWNGVIDSLSPEERKREDDEYDQRIYQMRLQEMIRRMDVRDQDRRENDHTYLWEAERTEAEFAKYEVEDEEEEYYSESESDLYDEDNPDDELDYGN